MAATEKGVWDLQDVRDKELASEWSYDGATAISFFGQNASGALGQNNTVQYSSPVQIPGLARMWNADNGAFASKNYDASTGGYDLWAWGQSSSGSLGLNAHSFWNGSTYANSLSSPIQVGSEQNYKFVMQSANKTSLAIKTDGSLWSWGNNAYGMMGQNAPENPGRRSSPTQVGTDTTWGSESGKFTGTSNNVWNIKTDGSLWGWGRNVYGSLGLNQGPPWNTGKSSPTQIGTDTTWLSVSDTGGSMSYFQKTDGTLWAWGYGQSGQILQPDKNSYSSPKQIPGDWTGTYIDGDNYVTHVIKTDGTLWGWGGGPSSHGMLGKNNMVQYSSPVQIGTDDNWAPASSPDTQRPISHGGDSVLARKTDGTVWSWGRGQQGRGDRNETVSRSSPVQMPGTSFNSTEMNSGYGTVSKTL
tara:strand:- start:82 stop:1323 length:1242 start_codon:yes stop_codon:yes gene_type:complete